jgi:DNA-binding CsgD family transcriptional regulator
MSEATKRDVHLRLAQFVVNPEERAHHLALSVSEPDVDVAAELETAARDAHARGAWTAGAELLEHAVRLSPQRDPGVVPRTIAAADSHFQAGDTSRTLSLLESLSRDVASGPDRAEVLYRLAAVRGELDSDLRASMELYESALAEPSLEPLLAARIHSDLAWLASFVSSVGDGLAHAETAVALTAEIDSPETRAEALTALSFAQTLAGKGSPDGLLDPALELESSGERFRIDRSPTLVAGIKLLWSGDLEAARLRFESLRIRAFERGDETNSSIARYHLALLELQRGRIDEAVEHTREAAQLAEQTGVNVPEVRLLGAVMDAHLGRVDAAISAAVDLLANAERAHDQMNAARALGILGFVELSRGQAVEAHAYLARAFALVNEIGLGEPAFLRFIPDAVEALVSLARPDEAAAMLKRFEEAARQAGHAWALASVDRCRGLVRAAAGDLPGGLADLERAREAQQHLPFPFELARTLLALGTIERRSKRRGRARASLERALALFEQVSAPLWADRARAELDQIGGRTSAGLELTPQEQRIAELVAAGGTNREVAAALFVTVHTVEGALTRIYGKVGVRSRTELAARLAKSKSKL